MSGWTIVPAALLSAAMLASLLRKTRRAPASLDLRRRLGAAPVLWSAIGGLEACAVAGLVVGLARPAVGAAAAGGVGLLMLGALVAHLRGRAHRPAAAPARRPADRGGRRYHRFRRRVLTAPPLVRLVRACEDPPVSYPVIENPLTVVRGILGAQS